MAAMVGNSPLVTDSDVDALAWRFLRSSYADGTYADWPLDQRLDGFLRRCGLVRISEDGDTCNLLLNRVMAHIGKAPIVKSSGPTISTRA
jgi:hypothetical protein